MSRLICDTRFSVAKGLGMLMLLGCVGGCGVPLSWDSREELIEITPAGVQGLSLKTINGQIRVRASDDPDSLIEVTANIKGGAGSPEDVEACLDAIEITITDFNEATPQISWRWRDGHQSGWSGIVSFEAIVPKRLGIVADTQNGAIDVTGAEGDYQLKSQNGRIRTLGSNSSLHAETHNGGLFVQSTASEVQLSTHNGAIEGELKSTAALNGKVESHNGSIQLSVNPWSSTKLSARTKNGRIESELPLDDEVSKRKTLVGSLGTGAGALEVSTHNGSITLRATNADAPLPEESAEVDVSESSDEAPEAEEEPDEPEAAAAESEDEASKGEEQPEDTDPPAEEDEEPATADENEKPVDEPAA